MPLYIAGKLEWEFIGTGSTVTIPAGYTVLNFIASGMMDSAAVQLEITFNSDTTAGNYAWSYVQDGVNAKSTSDDAIRLCSAGTNAGEWSGRIECIVSRYGANGWFHGFGAEHGYNIAWYGGVGGLRGGNTVYAINGFGVYNGAAAITSITVTATGPGTPYFSNISVYGSKRVQW